MNELEVSVIIVALNEEQSLPILLGDLKRQGYNHARMEVLLVDSMSRDKTRDVMEGFVSDHDFKRVICLENPNRILASGWNVALEEARGDIIIRLDAHASVPADFVEKNVRCILEGHDICGGKVKNYMPEQTPWKLVLNAAESSMFGGSIAAFRRREKGGNVNTLAFAAYRREVFEKTGYFNETLYRTEDNEMHYRMRKNGFCFYYDPRIESCRETRPSFIKLSRQKYKNGYWIGRTIKICPGCVSVYHLIPFLFLSAILITAALASIGIWQPAACMWLMYAATAAFMTIAAFMNENRNLLFLALPLLFLALHISYGAGTCFGFFTIKKVNFPQQAADTSNKVQ